MSKWVSVKERLPQKAGWLKARRTNGSEEKFYFNPVLTTRFPKGFSQIKGAFSWRQDDVVEWLDEETEWKMDCEKCPYKKTCEEMGEIELSCEDIKKIAECGPYQEVDHDSD